MGKTIVNTATAPAAIGPYSQAVKIGNLLFISGQIPVDPQSGELVGGPIETQTHRVMENIGAVLHSQGLSFENVVKTTLYVKSIDDFEIINRVYGNYFQCGPPARACVEVSRLPKGVGIEIEAVAAY